MSGTDWSSGTATICELMTGFYLDPRIAERINEHLHRCLEEGAYRDVEDASSLAGANTDDPVAISGDLHLPLRYSIASLPKRDDPVVPC